MAEGFKQYKANGGKRKGKNDQMLKNSVLIPPHKSRDALCKPIKPQQSAKLLSDFTQKES